MDSELLYFADDDEGHEIDVLLLRTDHLPVSGRVCDVYVDGVGVRLPKRANVPVGERVELALSVDPDERPVTLSAVVRTRREAPTYRRYGFRFVSRDEIETKLPRGLYSIFNRRRSERFALTATLPVTVSAAGECAPVPAKLHGASRTGCSILIEPKGEAQLSATEQVTLSFEPTGPRLVRDGEPPDAGRAISLIVHNRQLTGDGEVRYGCEFDPRSPAERDEIARLVDWLVEREGRLRAG